MNREQNSQKDNAFSAQEIYVRARKYLINIYGILITRITSSPPYAFLTASSTVTYIKEAAECILITLSSFFLGRCQIGFGTYPFGMALLICSGRLSFFAYAGSALASLTYSENPFALFGVNTLIYVIRKLLLSDSFSESRKKRVLLSLGTGLFISLATITMHLTRGGEHSFSQNVFPSIIIYMSVLPLSVYLLYPLFTKESFSNNSVKLSLTLFSFLIIMSPNFSLPCGFEIALFLAVCASLLYLCFFGGTFSLFACALFGVATLELYVAIPLVFSAFVFVTLYEKHSFLSHISFAATFLTSSLLLFDANVAFRQIGIIVFAASLAFSPIGIYIGKKRSAQQEAPASPGAEVYTSRMANLSGAFSSVSKLCFGYSGRLRFPSSADAQIIINSAQSKECSSCPVAKSCKYQRLYADTSLSQSLLSGKLTVGKLPERLRGCCPSATKIVDRINDSYSRLLEDRFNNNKTEILAYEYSSIAKILKYTCRECNKDAAPDPGLASLAKGAAKKFGFSPKSVKAYGIRKKTIDICGISAMSVRESAEKIAAFFSAECDIILSLPEFILEEDGSFTVRLVSRERLSVEYTKATHTKTGEAQNGDTVSFFKSTDSFFYSLIADGMGSGRDAAMTSRITAVFVEKLLSGGAGKGVTLEMLNNLLLSKNKECFSSVDLFELDLIGCRGSFVKAGAAPAYLLRAAKLFRVSSDTPPCGIVEGFSAENTGFDVLPGDLIIMLSDGITSALDCGDTLCEIMKQNKGAPLDALASKILDVAVSSSVHDDDMSCVLVRVK